MGEGNGASGTDCALRYRDMRVRMANRPVRNPVMPAPSRARFTSIELIGWPALGGDVRLSVAPESTILVGRNGAGKSAILEGVSRACRRATLGMMSTPMPGQFRCSAESEGSTIHYEFTLSPGDEPELADVAERSSRGPVGIWTEKATLASGEVLWEVKDGQVVVKGSSVMRLPTNIGLLTVSQHDEPRWPPACALLQALFRGVVSVPAGVPRQDGARHPVYMERFVSRKPPAPIGRGDRVTRLTRSILNWGDRLPHLLKEFEAIGQRINLWSEVSVKVYSAKGPSGDADEIGEVLVDDVNFGMLSDGTLRVAEILQHLITPRVTLLLVEEPETSVHPGLLSRLMAEVEAYAQDRQVILSTHSTEIVTRTHPEDLRLVERVAGSTTVRALTSAHKRRIKAYLKDDGTLGEFVFGGALE